RTFPVADGETLIVGRGQDTLTRLQDPRVSRHHFTLKASAGIVCLTDGAGASGTLVNGVKVAQSELHPGDLITVGVTTLRLDVKVLDATTLAPTGRRGNLSVPVEDLSDLIGKTLHHYQITRELAQGAMGAVFLARHTTTGNNLAVKVLWPALS